MRQIITIRLILVLFIIALAVFGCSRKTVNKSSTSSEVLKNDSLAVKETLVKNKEEVKTPPTDININAGNPCDSNGNLKVVYVEVYNGKNKSVIDTRSGTLKTNCYCDSVVSRLEKELYTKDSVLRSLSAITEKEAQVITNTVYKIPLWYWVVTIALAILFVLSTYAFFKTLITKFR